MHVCRVCLRGLTSCRRQDSLQGVEVFIHDGGVTILTWACNILGAHCSTCHEPNTSGRTRASKSLKTGRSFSSSIINLLGMLNPANAVKDGGAGCISPRQTYWSFVNGVRILCKASCHRNYSFSGPPCLSHLEFGMNICEAQALEPSGFPFKA